MLYKCNGGGGSEVRDDGCEVVVVGVAVMVMVMVLSYVLIFKNHMILSNMILSKFRCYITGGIIKTTKTINLFDNGCQSGNTTKG